MSLLFPRRALALLIAACLSVLVTGQQDVMFAQTAEQFQEAVMSGIRHIIIKRHLDLRYLSPDPAAQVPGTLLVITSKTKSIRVCSEATTVQVSTLLAQVSIFEYATAAASCHFRRCSQ